MRQNNKKEVKTGTVDGVRSRAIVNDRLLPIRGRLLNDSRLRSYLNIEPLVMMGIITGILLFCLAVYRVPLYSGAAAGVVAMCITVCLRMGISLGSKAVWIPLAILTLIILIGSSTWQGKLFAVSMLPVYMASLKIGKNIYLPMTVLVIAGTLSVIIFCFLEGIEKTGGMFNSNYNIAVGILVLGTVVSRQWWLYPIMLTGLIFTGASEAIVVAAGLLTIGVIYKQWKTILWSLAAVSLTMAIITPLGITQKLWHDVPTAAGALVSDRDLDAASGNRIEPYRGALGSTSILGHGYQPFDLTNDSIHNTPLRVLNETGFLGLTAWCWLFGWGIFKSKMKLLWVSIGLLSLFDHFMWTQLGIWWWCSLGTSQDLQSVPEVVEST